MGNNTKAIVEGAMLAGIAAIMAIASTYVPFLSLFYIVFPVPIAIAGYKYGLKISILSLLVASLIIAVLSHPLSFLGSIALGIVGVGIGYFQHKKAPAATALIGVFFLALFTMLLELWVAFKFMGIDVISQIVDMFKQATQLNMDIYKRIGVSGQTLQDMDALTKYMLNTLKTLMPFIIIASVSLMVFVNYIVTNFILKRLGYKDIVTLPPFSTWLMPKSAAIVFSVFIAAGFFIKAESMGKDMVQVWSNLLALGFMAFFIDGLSLVSFYMKKVGMSRFFQAVIFIMLLFYSYFNILVFMAGLLDAGMDFRRLRGDSRR
ncbi:YybS family protein [Caldanaerobius polysaccharolyticus]|uniref:YybS family protein n=1 Tax=Caldanaerobius polysaccharolyticus TaxID=44256 RepID=UPI0004786C64|nr:DUF2232 domain-containing protein [Caldanaerobius polysaccharolyticus]